MTTIVDYSAGYPSPAAVAAAGHSGVIRYLRKNGASRVKPVTREEYVGMIEAGLSVAFIYQALSTGRVLEGYAAGKADATWAAQQAVVVTGGTMPRAIYFAVDRDIRLGGEFNAVSQYLLGAGDVLGVATVGVYGEFDVIESFVPSRAAWGWQTNAWSGGRRSRRAHLYQYADRQPTIDGVPVDVNDVLQPDYGQDTMQITSFSPAALAQLQNAVATTATGTVAERNAGTATTWLQDRLSWTDINMWRVIALLDALSARVAAIDTEGDDRDAAARMRDAELLTQVRGIREDIPDGNLTAAEHARFLTSVLPEDVLEALTAILTEREKADIEAARAE